MTSDNNNTPHDHIFKFYIKTSNHTQNVLIVLRFISQEDFNAHKEEGFHRLDIFYGQRIRREHGFYDDNDNTVIAGIEPLDEDMNITVMSCLTFPIEKAILFSDLQKIK